MFGPVFDRREGHQESRSREDHEHLSQHVVGTRELCAVKQIKM